MPNKLKLGHTGITWKDAEIEDAVKTLAELGFAGMETFGFVLEALGEEGNSDLFERHGIPLASAYCPANLVDPAKKDENKSKFERWTRLLVKHGCKTVVLGGESLDRRGYNFAERKAHIVGTLNETGRLLADSGILCCFHPHTGTPVQTEAEIRAVMDAVDPKAVAFAPDVGQIQKGGTDALQIVKDYYPLLRHVHFKDWVGGDLAIGADGKEIDRTGYQDYTPLGEGVVDLAGILALLEERGFDGWVMVELDGRQYGTTAYTIEDARKSALTNKRYLEGLGYRF